MKRLLIMLAAAAVIVAQMSCTVLGAEGQSEQKTPQTQSTQDTAHSHTAKEKMTVKFHSTSPDEDGVFKLMVSFDRMRFTVYRFALRFDTEAVEPYNPETKSAAQKFAEFASPFSHAGLSRIGETYDAEQGIIDFTGFVLKDGADETSGFVFDGVEAVTEDNFVLYEFTFRCKDGKKPYFEFAMADGKGAYGEIFPVGAVVLGEQGEFNATAIFTYENAEESERTVTFDSVKYSNTPKLTKSERLKDTLYLQKGNYAAASDGALAVIDSADKAVAPQDKDGVLYVPLRFVCEKFGMSIEWNESQRKAVVSGNQNHRQVYEVCPDKTQVLSQGEPLDGMEPYISNDRIYIDINSAAKLCGAKVFNVPEANAAVLYKGLDWIKTRYAETEALSGMQFVVSPFVKMFA